MAFENAIDYRKKSDQDIIDAGKYTKTESDAKFEQVSKKDTSIPQTPVTGNYPSTQAIKSYIDSVVGSIPNKLFFYSFDYGQFAAGAPAIPSGVVLVTGDELYNLADGKNWKWIDTSWVDITTSITKTLLEGSTAIFEKMFVDGVYKGLPGSTIYEISGSSGTWYPFPQYARNGDNVTIELKANGSLGIKDGSIGSTQLNQTVSSRINNAVQSGEVYTKTESDTLYFQKEHGKELLNADDRKKLDWIGSETINSLVNMTITRQIVHSSISSSQTLSIASVALNNAAFVIVVTATAAITITMPAGSDILNMGDANYPVAANSTIEIHVFYSTISNKYHLSVREKS